MLSARTLACLLACAALLGCEKPARDEAKRAGLKPESIRAAHEPDYFAKMDYPAKLTDDEIKGRNTWLVWTGGNDRLWDWVAVSSEGALDLLKTISSHPDLPFSRDKRWKHFGLVNDPCYEKPAKPDEFGIWRDVLRPGCTDPFADEKSYPGAAIGGRGKTRWGSATLPVGSIYGYGTGIVGLRLFPNPDFDEKAAKNWKPDDYYKNKEYYTSDKLVRPYRVGMACGFCHVGPNPLRPPADAEKPQWENLSSNVGAQYFKVGPVFAWQQEKEAFLKQLFDTSRPGTLDTSFVPTDGINNPRNMNALYLLDARLQHARRWGKEHVRGAGMRQKHLAGTYDPPHTVWVPHILKDGADSAGALAALNRVYFNIGVFSEEMLLHVNPLVGGVRQSPMEIAVARRNSVYWQATEAQTADVAGFLIKASAPHKLKDALGKDYRPRMELLRQGKLVFAENCAHCHSSKLPAGAPFEGGACAGENYLVCLQRYRQWTRTPAFKEEMRRKVLAEDFLDGNLLSNELRIPVTILQTNACSAVASNAVAGHVWDNFSSDTYKNLPAVGAITVRHPVTGEARRFVLPAGGRGYSRVPSLVGLWSTAPYLLNNSVGIHVEDPSVAGRLKAFDDGIRKMLWPERREKDEKLKSLGVGWIDRTKGETTLHVSEGFLPTIGRLLWPFVRYWSGAKKDDSGINIRIPDGTPIGLIANIQVHTDDPNLLHRLRHYWKVARLAQAALEERSEVELVDRMLDLNKCPDFEVNKGHYFGATLPDADKEALIEFLKTF